MHTIPSTVPSDRCTHPSANGAGSAASRAPTHAVGTSWAARTAEVQALPPTVQPF